MERFRTYLQAHPKVVTGVVLGYVVFAGCFAFPLWSQQFPLEFGKVVQLVIAYGVIALGFAELYGAKQETKVGVLTLGLTGVGLVCRYLLEFGEVSNTYNFTLFQVVLYVGMVTGFTVVAYHFLVKFLLK